MIQTYFQERLCLQDAKIELGDLMVSMSYLSSAERLTVVLIKARNLRVVDDSRNSSDPYVKVSLIHNGKKIKKRKSGVYRSTVCPVFNEALTFNISKDILKNCLIEFLVVHDSLLGMHHLYVKWLHCKLNKFSRNYHKVQMKFLVERLLVAVVHRHHQMCSRNKKRSLKKYYELKQQRHSGFLC